MTAHHDIQRKERKFKWQNSKPTYQTPLQNLLYKNFVEPNNHAHQSKLLSLTLISQFYLLAVKESRYAAKQ
jgi:hypothetical protein